MFSLFNEFDYGDNRFGDIVINDSVFGDAALLEKGLPVLSFENVNDENVAEAIVEFSLILDADFLRLDNYILQKELRNQDIIHDGLGKLVKDALTAIKNFIMSLINAIKKMFSSVINWIKGLFGKQKSTERKLEKSGIPKKKVFEDSKKEKQRGGDFSTPNTDDAETKRIMEEERRKEEEIVKRMKEERLREKFREEEKRHREKEEREKRREEWRIEKEERRRKEEKSARELEALKKEEAEYYDKKKREREAEEEKKRLAEETLRKEMEEAAKQSEAFRNRPKISREDAKKAKNEVFGFGRQGHHEKGRYFTAPYTTDLSRFKNLLEKMYKMYMKAQDEIQGKSKEEAQKIIDQVSWDLTSFNQKIEEFSSEQLITPRDISIDEIEFIYNATPEKLISSMTGSHSINILDDLYRRLNKRLDEVKALSDNDPEKEAKLVEAMNKANLAKVGARGFSAAHKNIANGAARMKAIVGTTFLELAQWWFDKENALVF